MDRVCDKVRGLKRTIPVNPSNASRELSIACYLTKGAHRDEWHVWNISPLALPLHKGERIQPYLVGSDFERGSQCRAYILKDFTVSGMASTLCVVQRDIRFKEPIAELASVASQVELVNLCLAKGIKCALFLEHHMADVKDCELQLGSHMNSVFVYTVREMLKRNYDVMHHYPLFNRAVSLHYSDEANLDPPEVNDVIATGGLLDRSVAEHESLHGIPVTRVDGVCFSHWNYPSGDKEKEGSDGGCQAMSSETRASSHTQELGASSDVSPGGELRCEDAPHAPREEWTENDLARGSDLESREQPREVSPMTPEQELSHGHMSVHSFNNHPGTLTDRPTAFPYSYTVYTGRGVTFNDLVDYCVTRTAEPIGGLPSRKEWGTVNPVLLMEDPVDSTRGKPLHRYTITSRGHLSSTVNASNSKPCYNEVFLAGRPVSRLNLDLDLKCCKQCNTRFATQADPRTKRKVSEALAMSLILVIFESLLRMAKVTREELAKDQRLRDLTKSIGKISVYIRASPVKSKLSLRMLWYLPVELCSVHGIEAHRPLLEEMEKSSLNYVLLSYPSSLESCGLCELGDSMTRSASGSRCLRLGSAQANARHSAIDRAPYSFRKCVRLPNCYKEDSRFEYMGTFNGQEDIEEDPGLDDPLSLSVGLSANMILSDVTSLGSRFQGVLRAGGLSQQLVFFKLDEEPDQARVRSEAKRLMSLWGVPVTVRKTGSGLFCVQANEKSTTYPCPIHNRVHTASKLSALVFATCTKHKCFVS